MSGSGQQRRPGRWSRRRRQTRDEDFILRYPFPEQIETKVRKHEPGLQDKDWKLVEQGLREWFLCCAWREGEVLGMPSRIVDEAWHEFILDSLAYTAFCEEAFGTYLHHTPDAAMTTPMSSALDNTARAWDRSGQSHAGSSLLWGLDSLLGGAGGDGGGHHHQGGSEGGSEFGGGEGSGGESGESGGGGDSGGGGGDSGGGGCGGGGCGGGGE
jgi:hypothetical protein